MFLIFDTETTGLPKSFSAPVEDTDNWPRVVQISWQLHQKNGKLINNKDYIIYPQGYDIPYKSSEIHGITTEIAKKEGVELQKVLQEFYQDIEKSELIIGHNIDFDIKVMYAESLRENIPNSILKKEKVDTMFVSTEYVGIPGRKGYKWPKLGELYQKLFDTQFPHQHNAAFDTEATARCFFALLEKKIIPSNIEEEIHYQAPSLQAIEEKTGEEEISPVKKNIKKEIPFVHLHTHTHYSILQSTVSMPSLIKKAQDDNMESIAITDFGNLYGAFEANSHQNKNFKVLVGSEFYVAKERKKHGFTREAPDEVFQQILIATNQKGYQNMVYLSSIGFKEGYYMQRNRIDKLLIEENKEGLIALSGGIHGEFGKILLNEGEIEAEKILLWWKEQFKDNFYISLSRQGIKEEKFFNETALRLADKHQIKYVATHEIYYLEKEEAEDNDILQCIRGGNVLSMEKGIGRKYRYSLPSKEYDFKTQKQMNELFGDLPQALHNTIEIANKCQPIELQKPIDLPHFEIPQGFSSQEEYLEHLTYKGAEEKYKTLTEEIKKRIVYELEVITKMNFVGYFLIVQDLIQQARKMGVFVGPGRGSVAGSIIAYCIDITRVDPIKYLLLFERFLNPERVSMPDIDIDFDDKGRDMVIDYVSKKYGSDNIAHIITFNVMKAKMSIRDVGRVKELPLRETLKLTKLVPNTPNITLERAYRASAELKAIKNQKNSLASEVLSIAQRFEGVLRNTGVHAAGIIIAPQKIYHSVPTTIAKDVNLLVTQFDGKVIEKAGMLKMDFLGLKNLSTIKDTLEQIKKRHGIELDIENIPLDDAKTFSLYQKGLTGGTFQFESSGMQSYLKKLIPTEIEDLIAMNALYRPGPMQFIELFIERKHKRKEIEYPHKLLEPILKKTHGIMVYQEQIMQTAQILADYSLAEADLLRKAMGKKNMKEMEEQEKRFIEGVKTKQNINRREGKKIFEIMKKFAEYGFNRSHSTAYTLLAYQTGYLKANYPKEYLCALMNSWMQAIDKIADYIEKAREMEIEVILPDINESEEYFHVNKAGNIRFGLRAIKNTSDQEIIAIIKERNKNGDFKDIWDFIHRIGHKNLNKKTLEALALSGTLDSICAFDRSQWIQKNEDENHNGVEKMIKYGQQYRKKKEKIPDGLFPNATGVEIEKPKIDKNMIWSDTQRMNFERQYIGFYLSGHPVEKYGKEIASVKLKELDKYENKKVHIVALVNEVKEKNDKNNEKYGIIEIEDMDTHFVFFLFKEKYSKFQSILIPGKIIHIYGNVKRNVRFGDKLELQNVGIKALEKKHENDTDGKKIQIDMNIFSEEKYQQLIEITEAFSGEIPLIIECLDTKENRKLQMVSEKYRVNEAFFEKVKGICLIS